MKKFDSENSSAPKKAFVADLAEAAIGITVTFVAIRLISKVLTAAVTPPQQTVYYVVQPQQQTPAA
jgi:type IV secretory pathway component VirB8